MELEHFQQQWTEGSHSDVRISVFGKVYNLHKVILSQSKYFSAAFSGRWVLKPDADPGVFVVDLFPEEHTPAAVESALRWLYGFHPDLSDFSTCLGIHAAASFFQIEHLLQRCVKRLTEFVNTESAPDIYGYFWNTEKPGAGSVLDKCKVCLLRQALQKPTSLARLPLDAVVEILHSDALILEGGEYERFLLVDKVVKEIEALTIFEGGETLVKEEWVKLKRTGRGIKAESDGASLEFDEKEYSSSVSSPKRSLGHLSFRSCDDNLSFVRQQLYGCCRLEFITAKQLLDHEGSSKELDDLIYKAAFQKEYIRFILKGERPLLRNRLRPYRCCVVLSTVVEGIMEGSSLFEAYGSRWQIALQWERPDPSAPWIAKAALWRNSIGTSDVIDTAASRVVKFFLEVMLPDGKLELETCHTGTFFLPQTVHPSGESSGWATRQFFKVYSLSDIQIDNKVVINATIVPSSLH
mmetsp:Transcript_45609/g.74348  ORF Transcript_45609/g.74348 Transcript_45609/m.74348 type:complete len:466 (+) Transcript_45609:214-1611(+)